MKAARGESAATLEARLEDYLACSSRGEASVSRFLTPGERKQAERFLAHRGATRRAFFWGGYSDAERTCLFLAPEYMEDVPDLLPEAGSDPAEPLGAEDERVCAVRIRGSGFRKLSHRDYLGSLLGLGLERDVLGDVAVQDDFSAVVFCGQRMASFLLTGLEKVGNDTVRCALYEPDDAFTDGRQYQPIADTVASARLDCVVAALTNLSREAAQTAVRSGLVEVDFEAEDRVDHILIPPATVSVRGHGRFILRSFDGETKKGRLRLRADKLV